MCQCHGKGQFLRTLSQLFSGGLLSLHNKWSFSLRISLVNMTKFAGTCGFSQIYWTNPWWKTLFLVQCNKFLNKLRFRYWLLIVFQMDGRNPETVAQRCSVKMLFFEILQNSQETPVPESLYQKRDSGTGAFLWLLQNF